MGYPIGSGLRGLARVTFESEIDPREFDLPFVPRGTEPEVSDWRRRQRLANDRGGNITRAADALAESLASRQGSGEPLDR